MSGPIVRTGTNPKFWSNWEQAFGKKSTDKAAAAPEAAKKAAAPKKAAKKAAPKKAK